MFPDLNRGIGRFNGFPHVAILPAPAGMGPTCTRVLLLADLSYTACDGRTVIAPAGLVSDGASFPSALWIRFGHPLSSQNAPFGLVHDAIYRLALGTKEEADMLAFGMARCSGHSDTEALAIWEGLRVGAGPAWDSNAAKRVACGSDLARLLAWA